MSDHYAELAEAELVAARHANDMNKKVVHLDRAAAFATQSERERAERPEGKF